MTAEKIRSAPDVVGKARLLAQVLYPFANTLYHQVAVASVTKLHVSDRPFGCGLRQGHQIIFREMHDQMLRQRDDSAVDESATLQGQTVGLRQSFALDLFLQLFQLSDFLLRGAVTGLHTIDTRPDARPLEESFKSVH